MVAHWRGDIQFSASDLQARGGFRDLSGRLIFMLCGGIVITRSIPQSRLRVAARIHGRRLKSEAKSYYPLYVLNLPCLTPRTYPRDTRSSISRSKNSFAINSAFTAPRASPPQAAIA